MATKKYVVRAGFNFRRTREIERNGKVDKVEEVFYEGDFCELDTAIGDASHQLEYAEEADRAAALKAEQKAARAAQAAAPAAIDYDQLAAAMLHVQAAAPAPVPAGQ